MNISGRFASARWKSTLLPILVLFSLAYVGSEESSSSPSPPPPPSCSPYLQTAGWTVPFGDIVLEEGSNLTYYCRLHDDTAKQKKYSSSQLFIIFNHQRVPQRNISVLNDTTISLQLNNLTTMTDWLYCKLDLSKPPLLVSSMEDHQPETTHDSSPVSGSSLEDHVPEVANASKSSNKSSNETLVCTNMLSVGTKPKDVENFACYSYDWRELNCTWLEPENDVPVVYKLAYQLPKRGGRSTNYYCPRYDDLGTVMLNGKEARRIGCSWTPETQPSYRNNFEYFSFQLSGENALGNISRNVKFHNYAHIIPAAPREFAVVDKTVSSVRLEWRIDLLITFDKGWIYQINYTYDPLKNWTTLEYNQKDKLIEKDRDRMTLNVTGLEYPNTAYDFRVAMRSAVAPQNEGWSEPSSLVTKTKPCPPYRAPRTDRAGFEISARESTDDYRVLYVYWQAIPPREYNGDNFTYDITVFQDGVLVNVTPQTLQNSYAKYRLGFGHYKFEIRSKNEEGLSKSASTVHVPSKSEALRTPTILSKIDFEGGMFELTWKAPEGVGAHDVNYTVFWCESNRDHPYQCDGVIDWQHVSGGVTKMNFTTNNTAIGHQFAVSAVSANSSSGMTWASCTILHDTVNRIHSLWIDKVESYSILVRWKLECSNRVDGVKGYYLYYCTREEQDQNGCSKDKEKTVTVYGDLELDHASVSGLEPFTEYQITVSMFTNNVTGPRSKILMDKTLDGPPNVTGIDFESTSATNTSITLQWKPINKTNGVLQRYVINYGKNETEVPPNVTSVVLQHLNSYQQYEIKLRGCTNLCSDPVGPLKVTTKIGKPGSIVVGPSMENLNASHMIAVWNKLTLPGGPRPVFEVKIISNDTGNVIGNWETADNYTVLDKEICSSGGQPAIQVRGINRDEKNNQTFEGDWSKLAVLTCPYGEMSTTIYVLFIVGTLLSVVFGAVTWGRKGFTRCQDMKNVNVTLPAPLTVPPYTKERDFNEEYYQRNMKSTEESRTLVDNPSTPNTEMLGSQILGGFGHGTSMSTPLIEETVF